MKSVLAGGHSSLDKLIRSPAYSRADGLDGHPHLHSPKKTQGSLLSPDSLDGLEDVPVLDSRPHRAHPLPVLHPQHPPLALELLGRVGAHPLDLVL
jgi:hypothetical protein